MENQEYLWWTVPVESTGLPEGVMVLVVESLAGKRRLFVPGRRSTPLQVREFNRRMVVHTLRSLISAGWVLEPQNTVGVSVLTEGAGVPFLESFDLIWPDLVPGGVLHIWARRKMGEGVNFGGTYAHFEAQLKGLDVVPVGQINGGWTGILFDIGATGATMGVVVQNIATMFRRLVFASPCTSLVAARKFVEAAIGCDLEPANLAVIAGEGFFGLHGNGTYLSLQLPGTITSRGNQLLSTATYPHPAFCHIGAGGLAANWPRAYQAELSEDEARYGNLYPFDSLEGAMNHAGGLKWPEDFGSPF